MSEAQEELIDPFYMPPEEREPGFKYRWLNNKDQNMLNRKWQGWEVVQGPPESPLPQQVLSSVSQETGSPGGGTIRQRGDLVLARMPVERWKEKIQKKIHDRRDRQQSTLDTMIFASNERAQKAAQKLGLGRIPKDLVFAEENS